MTKLFHISRQGYYQFKKRVAKRKSDHELIKQKVLAYRKEMPRIGGRKLFYLLKPVLEKSNISIGRDKLFDLLRDECLLVKKRRNYAITTRSYHRFRKHPNRIKEKTITQPEQVWVSDMTYVKCKEGNLYLNLITDAYSKKIMGYDLADNMKTESSIKALKRAIKNREYCKRRLIHHSDRGFQYCSTEYTNTLATNQIDISMTTKYDPYENAIAERVNGILKDEFYISDDRLSKQEAIEVVKRSIQVYNEKRPHMSCHYLTPNQAHQYGQYDLRKWSKKNYNNSMNFNH